MILALTGMMGCGKSSTGKALAELLEWPFLDLDTVIEARQGRSIPDIFKNDGEAAFRQMEAAALTGLLKAPQKDFVLALGGGTILTPDCADLVHGNTICWYLRTSAPVLAARLQDQADSRPLLQTPDELLTRIRTLLADRETAYLTVAHHVADTDKRTPGEVARFIKESI